MNVKPITAVFVPHEWNEPTKTWVRLDTLPRFSNSRDVIMYLRRNQSLRYRRLDWIEHSDKESINEFIRGVGTSKITTH